MILLRRILIFALLPLMIVINSLELLNNVGFFLAKCRAEIQEIYLLKNTKISTLNLKDETGIKWLSSSEIIYNGQLLDVIQITHQPNNICIKYVKDNWEQMHLLIQNKLSETDNSGSTNAIQQLHKQFKLALPEPLTNTHLNCFINQNKPLFFFNSPTSNCYLMVEKQPPNC
jgi:hypothetical protein